MNDLDERNDPPRPFLEHIQALRDAVIGIAVAWLGCVILAGCFAPCINDWILGPARSCADISDGLVSIEGLDLTSGFDVIMQIALWGGTALAFPFMAYFILRFVFPALTRREQLSILVCISIGSVFFLAGVWMAYAKTLPVVVDVFLAFAKWVHLTVNTIKVDGYIRIVLKTIIAFGVALQLPLVLFVLGWLGVISSDTLRRQRRTAIVVSFVLAMCLTPPDPMSQIVMALPMCVMYEACIWIIKVRELTAGRRNG